MRAPARASRARAGASLLAAILATSCAPSCHRQSTTTTSTTDAGAETGSTLPQPDPRDVALDMLEQSPRCHIEHRGVLIDVGSIEAAWSTPGHPDTVSDLPAFERDGATWGRVLDRTQSFVVALDASGGALVSIRGRARGARKVSASVDGKLIGTLTLATDEDKTVTVSNESTVLAPGLHTLTLRWLGAVKKEEPIAELDWVRLGVIDDDASAYAAPTRSDAIAQVAIGGEPRRAFTLRAPAVVRCVAWIPAGATLDADIGAIGEGSDGEVELRERRSSAEGATMLVRRTALASAWTGVSAPLTVGGETGALAIVEIAVTRAPRQGRVAIAEPRVVHHAASRAAAPKPTPPRSVVVVVMAGLTTAGASLPGMQKLAHDGVVFRTHRAPSGLGAASVASLTTGLPVPVHALEDSGARVSPRTPMIGALLSRFGVETAMFTEVPTTGPAFGFAHDWTHYAARSPGDGPPAAFDEIEKFLEASVGKKTTIIAHARGAHPPWELTVDPKSLPPEGYNGVVDPKHVVSIIAKARKGLLRLTDADRVRLGALSDAGLAAQDHALDQLIESLRAAGTLDSTMIIVTSDAPFALPAASAHATTAAASASASAASSDAPPPPPAPAAEPAEDPLAIPLIIRFPAGFAAGRVVTAMTDPTDVAATIVAAFGASIADLGGRDLAQLAVDDERARDDARLLDDGRGYQLAWADLRLAGQWGKSPVLRERLGGEDVHLRRAYEYLAAWGLAADARARWLVARAKGPGREPATIDGATATALEAWERAK